MNKGVSFNYGFSFFSSDLCFFVAPSFTTFIAVALLDKKDVNEMCAPLTEK